MRGGPFPFMKRIALLLSLTIPALAADQASDLVKYRLSVMKAMAAHMKAVSMIATKQIANRSQLRGHAEAVHAMSTGLTAFFPKSTAPDKIYSESRPAIWQRWKEFEAAAKTLERDSANLVAASKGKDDHALAAAVDTTNKACAACHKDFREEHD
jgi:cytochrome c556